jgi:pyrimidine operon attenuation protein/uracil phosphoribosyltransferase
MNGENVTGQFILKFNDELTYFKDHDHHHAAKNIDKAVVASIPDQEWKGEPVVLIPDVMYEGKKLAFAKDCELSYHKNDKPGTASVIIHGKNAFKGSKTGSFNIVTPA